MIVWNSYVKLINQFVKLAIAAITIFAASQALAVPIFNITTTNTAVTVTPGAAVTFTYTVKNVSGVALSKVQYFPPTGTTVTDASTCGTNLANLASCSVVLKFQTPVVTEQPQQIKLGSLRVCAFGGKICSQSNAANTVTVTLADTGILVAAGLNNTGALPPLLAASLDAGATWSVKAVTGLPVTGVFEGSSCTGSGLTAICIAVGTDGVTNAPLLAVSTNGGNDWAVKPISGAPALGTLNGASCVGSGATAICVAVGRDNSANTLLVAVSTDGANTWTTKPITGAPVGSTFILVSASCTGSGSTAICAAVGSANQTGDPLLAVSRDGANTWTMVTVPFINGFLTSVSCSGTGSTAVCAAVGTVSALFGVPLVFVTQDGAVSWSSKTVTGIVGGGVLRGVSCTGNGASAVCAAAGIDFTTFAAALAVTQDGASTWVAKTIQGTGASTILNAASCVGSGATAICTVVGNNNFVGGGAPLIGVSFDGGSSFTAANITDSPAAGSFNAVACTGTLSTTVCNAAGFDEGTTGPLVAVTQDGAVTWQVKTVTGAPASGDYNASAATGG